MTRDQAVRRLTKIYGQRMAYRVDRTAGDADDRNAATIKAKTLRAQIDALDVRIKAREAELLADPAYQALLAERKAIRTQREALTHVLLSYRFQGGYVDRVIGAFHVEGQGDTWEQVFEQIAQKHPSGKAQGVI